MIKAPHWIDRLLDNENFEKSIVYLLIALSIALVVVGVKIAYIVKWA